MTQEPGRVPPPAMVVFDVNETLSDMSVLAGRFEEVGVGGHEAQTWFAAVLRDGFALTTVGENPAFADLAGEGLRLRLAGRVDDVDGAVEHVMAGFGSLDVHPDVVAGVHALRERGVRLVTLSNGSTTVAEGLLGRAGVLDEFEALLSVADAPAWKPAAAAYAHALDRGGIDAGDAMLVAVHPWDVDGASRAGLRTAWIDRSGGAAYPAYFRPAELVVDGVLALARRFA